MNFDLIIVNGDSFSNGDGATEQYMLETGKQTQDKISWAYFLSEQTNIPIINISLGGSSNEGIIRRTLSLFERKNFKNKNNFDFSQLGNEYSDFDFSDKKILFITQWSFFDRFNFVFKNSHLQIQSANLPECYTNSGIFEDKSNSFKMYMESKIDLDTNESNFNKFIYEYVLYNNYIKANNNNIFHVNFFIKQDFQNTQYNTLNQFNFNLITNRNINLYGLKTVNQESKGVICDYHFGVDSCKTLAKRFIDFIKKEYEL